jgi:uncharacterized membrane protein
MKTSVRRMTITGLMASLTFIATAFIHINIPNSTGYVNLGDVIILFTAVFVDPFAGALAGIIGAVFGDLYLGAAMYIPFTIFAKLFEALVAGYLYRVFKGKYRHIAIPLGALLIVPIYGLAYFILGGWSMVIASSPFDILQSLLASILTIILVICLRNTKLRSLSEE